jgi:hypothetical protein
MLFGLKNAPSEFQNIMNEIFTPFTNFSIIYIDDVFIFSKSIEQHWKHLQTLVEIIKNNRLVVPFIGINLFHKFLESLNYIADTLNGKHLTLQIDMFSISGIMTPRRVQNPKCLTPAEKGKAKVNEYEEFLAEVQQKIPQWIDFLNPNHTNSIILEEVLQTSAKFLGGNPTSYPIHI